MTKALNGTLQVALLFWKLLSKTLISWDVKLNEYNQCMLNKFINGKQCTIVWHVDDLKISHVEAKVVADIIKKPNTTFRKESSFNTTQGKVLEYLSMTIE